MSISSFQMHQTVVVFRFEPKRWPRLTRQLRISVDTECLGFSSVQFNTTSFIPNRVIGYSGTKEELSLQPASNDENTISHIMADTVSA